MLMDPDKLTLRTRISEKDSRDDVKKVFNLFDNEKTDHDKKKLPHDTIKIIVNLNYIIKIFTLGILSPQYQNQIFRVSLFCF